MTLIKNGRIVEDLYVHLDDGVPVPDGAAIIVSAERFLKEAQGLLERGAPTGVAWPNHRRVTELAPYLDGLALIALQFPNFKDGRGYSQARLLRERYRFGGELRATGQILRDQFVFLIRAGFDALEVVKPADAEAFAATLARYSVFYQPIGAGRSTTDPHRVTTVPQNGSRPVA
jgi:uncharacterized protein (DUF934 family)